MKDFFLGFLEGAFAFLPLTGALIALLLTDSLLFALALFLPLAFVVFLNLSLNRGQGSLE